MLNLDRQEASLNSSRDTTIGLVASMSLPSKVNILKRHTGNGRVFCEVARGTAEDIEKALDAAHAAAKLGARPPLLRVHLF